MPEITESRTKAPVAFPTKRQRLKMITGFEKQTKRVSKPALEGLVERLTAWAKSGLEALHGLSFLQLCLLGALALGAGYWALGVGLHTFRRVALYVLLLVAAAVIVRLSFPQAFCSVRWPYAVAAFCPKAP